MVLPALDPAAWRATHLPARRAAWGDVGEIAEHRDLAELLVNGAAELRAAHARLVEEGTPPAAAAMYVAGWFAGGVAEAVGWGLVAGGAGFVVDPASVVYGLHEEGWVVDVGVDGATVVDRVHPWAGLAEVEVVDDAEQVVARAVSALVTAVEPVIRACRSLAPVGSAGLWNEVGDALGGVLAYQVLLPVSEQRADVLRRAVEQPGVPWRATPVLATGRSALLGVVDMVQKGGCCLAYTQAPDEDSGEDGHADDADHAAFLEAFPPVPGEPEWCSTCSLRPFADCEARQVFWLERRHGRPAEVSR